MIRILSLCLLLTTWTTNGQFLYNYDEEDQINTQQADGYDSPLYKYNSPTDVKQNYPESLRSPPRPQEPAPVKRRAQPAPRTIREDPPEPEISRYEPDTEISSVEYQTEPDADYEDGIRRNQQRRRTTRRRQTRVRQMLQEVVEQPRYYGPSVFDKIELGQAPSGVYVPHDSLLNILRSDNSRSTHARQVSQPQPSRNSNIVYGNNHQSLQSNQVYQPTVSPFFGHNPVQRYQSNSQPQAVSYEDPDQDFYDEPQRNDQSHKQEPSPFYRPSSQEIQQEIRRQNRVSQPVQQPQVPVRTTQPRRSSNQRAQRQQVVEEVSERSAYGSDVRPSISEVRRQPSVQRFEEAPRRKQRVQEPVTDSPVSRGRATFKPARLALASLPDDSDGDGIPGEAGLDYPTLHSIPRTTFSCSDQEHNGYYADLETSCQVMHLCQAGGKQNSFLCPNGTIFSQEKFACQWWYKVNCQNAPLFYSINDRLYKVPEDIKRKN